MKNSREVKIFLERLRHISHGYWKSSILFAGIKIGIFDLLSSGLKSSHEISKRLKTDERATEILLNALCAMGLTIKKGKQYRNRQLSNKFLVKGKPAYKGNILLHLFDMWKAWGDLPEIIYKGEPSIEIQEQLKKRADQVQHFILAMDELAQEPSEIIATIVKPECVKKLLDVGGGPGTYCFTFLRRNPELKATIIDLKLPLKIARQLIKERGLNSSIELIEGNFLKVDFGKGYDLVLMSHILHSNSPEECAYLIKKGYLALEKGGRLLIHDFILNEDRVTPPSAAIFAVNMLVNTPKGRTYTCKEIIRWMKEAGLLDIRCYEVKPASRILIGEK